MSIPMEDYRTSIPQWVDTWLDIEVARTGKTKQQIGREIMIRWTKEQIHAHKVANRILRSNGMQSELFGDDTEDDGSDRNRSVAAGKARR